MKQDATESAATANRAELVRLAGAPPMFYCGCHRESGHYVWTESEFNSWRLWKLQPWGNAIDGGLQPPKWRDDGLARFTQEHGWSALSWWDNSIDTRPGSHSTFVVEGVHSAEEVLAMARRRFPWVFSRFKYDVVLGGGDK